MTELKITLTQGNLNNGHFYIPRENKLFPESAWGGNNATKAATPITVIFEGTNDRVTTDIDGTKRLLRNARGEIRKFFEANKLSEGDSIFISKINNNDFKVNTVSITEIL